MLFDFSNLNLKVVYDIYVVTYCRDLVLVRLVEVNKQTVVVSR